MWNKLRRYFLSGLVIFLPVTMTIILFVWTINFTDGILGRYLEPYFYKKFGFYVRGLSILIGVYLIVLIGFLATNYFGKRLYGFFENILIKLPFFRQVYPALKEIALFLFARDRVSFKQVVIVEYPSKGIYSLGFLTNETSPDAVHEKVKKELCNVFIPTVPNPITGFVIMVPQKEVIMTDLSVEDALKFFVSGGVVNP